MLRNYLNTAWRNLNKHRLFSLINIGSLSVAMTASIFIMMWVQNELRFDEYHPDAGQIYLIKNEWEVNENDTWIWENSPYPLHEAIESGVPEVEVVTHGEVVRKNELDLKIENRRFAVERAIYVDKNWFDVFKYEFIRGKPQSSFSHPYSLILTESKAQKIFGKTDVVGLSMEIDSTEYMIQAVVEDNPINSSFQFDVLMPVAAKLNTKSKLDEANNWLYLTHKTFVKLHKGADPEATADKITGLFRANRDHGDIQATLLPLKSMRIYNDFQQSAFKHVSSHTVKIFSLLAILLLFTASINYVNLSVALAGVRSKEISVRKVVGADRRQLFLQFMAESVLTALLALVLAVLLIKAFMPFFNAFTEMNFRFNPLEPHLAMLLFGTLLGVVLLTGAYPALLLSSFKPIRLIKGAGVFQLKDPILRKGLVVGQFALAIIMTVAATTIYKQLSFVQQQEAGYDRAQVFTVEIPERAFAPVTEYFRTTNWEGNNPPDMLHPVKQELLAQSHTKHVVRMVNNSVVDWSHVSSGGIDWEGRDPDYNPPYTGFVADADLNKIMNFRFVAGRWFDENRAADRQNVVLNETAVRTFGLEEPVIGRRFNQGRVIGVVKDFHYTSMHEEIGPVVIRTALPPFASVLMVEAQPGQVTDALRAAEAVWHRHFPSEPFNYRFLDEEFDQLYQDDQKALSFTMLFSGLTILISCLGLLGMAVFAAQKRTKEIGIRKALGATVASIVALLSKDFLKLVLVAFVVAVPVAYLAMSRWLEDFAYRIDLGVGVFVVAGVLAITIALLTVSYQALRAARTDPVKALRYE